MKKQIEDHSWVEYKESLKRRAARKGSRVDDEACSFEFDEERWYE